MFLTDRDVPTLKRNHKCKLKLTTGARGKRGYCGDRVGESFKLNLKKPQKQAFSVGYQLILGQE